MPSDTIKTLIVDDSPVIRRAVMNVLEEEADIEVVGVAVDGEDAIRKYLDLKPDVVTMDVIMPRMDGLSALKILAREHKVPVIMLSGVTNEGANITFRADNVSKLEVSLMVFFQDVSVRRSVSLK